MGGEASRINGKLGGGPQKENLLSGLTNLETGEPAAYPVPYFPSLKAAAHALKLDIAILRDAKAKNCDAFQAAGLVHKERVISWVRRNSLLGNQNNPHNVSTESPDDDLGLDSEEDYTIVDEAGGVGQTLKSLQVYERRAKRALDNVEKSTTMHPAVKTELIKARQDAWIKVVNALLKYDLSVSLAKRESGELLPIADAVVGVQALLAWHTVATSDALRNVIPECEGKTKYEIAALLDTALRSAIYRNFKLGVKLGKVPEWMGKTASDFVKAETPMNLNKLKASTKLEEY